MHSMRHVLESSGVCGCFHCGRRFPTSLVTKWLEEPSEEDTGLCPYCGRDTLIVGDEEHPLSTALLTLLYEWWFKEERNERMAETNSSPTFFSNDDYLRKGIPFSWTTKKNRRAIGKIGVFSFGRDDSSCPDDEEFRWILCDFEPGGEWGVRAVCDRSLGYEEYELVRDDGTSIPFCPCGNTNRRIVLDLVAEYGGRLIGLCSDTGYGLMRLYVDD